MAEPLILRFDVKDDVTPKTERARDALGRFAKETDKATRSSRKFDSTSKALGGSLTRLRKIAFSVKGALAGLGAGLGLGAAAREIAAFDRAIGQTAAVARATESEFQALSKAARDIGANTQFSATQAAEGLNVLVRANFSAADSVTVLEQAVSGATVANTDLETILSISTDALAIFGLAADETGRVIDTLTAADIRGKTSITELGAAIADVGPIFNKLGVDVEEVSAALAVMSNKGVTGSEAGRGLRTVFQALLDPTAKLKEVIEEVGLEIDDFNPRVTDFATILNNLGRFTPEQIARGFENFGATTVAALGGAGDQVRQFTEEIRNSQGITETLAGEIGDDLTGAFLRMKSAATEVILALGDAGLREILRSVLQGLTELLQELGQSDSAFRPIREFADFVQSNFPALKSIFKTSVVVPFQAIGIAVSTTINILDSFLAAINAIINTTFSISGLGATIDSLEDLDILIRSFARVFPAAGALIQRVFETLSVAGKGAVNTIKQAFEDLVNNTFNRVINGVNRIIDAINAISPANIERVSNIDVDFNVDENFVGIENLDARFQEIRDRFQQRLGEIDTEFFETTFANVGQRAGTEFTDKFIDSVATSLTNLEGAEQALEFGRLSETLSPEEFQSILDKFSELKAVSLETGKEVAENLAAELAPAVSGELEEIRAEIAALAQEGTLDLQLGQVDIALARGQITEVQAIQQKLALETQFIQTKQEVLRLQIAELTAAGKLVEAEQLKLELSRSNIDLARIRQGAELDNIRVLKRENKGLFDGAAGSLSQIGGQLRGLFGEVDQETSKILDTALQIGDALLQAFANFDTGGGLTGQGGFLETLLGGGGQQQVSFSQTEQQNPAQFFDAFLGVANTVFGQTLPQSAQAGLDNVVSVNENGVAQVVGAFDSGLSSMESSTATGMQGIAQIISQVLSSVSSSGGGGGGGGGTGIAGSLGSLVGTLIGNAIKKQDGGIVPGQGRGDKVPALLEPGEFVLTRGETKALGLDKSQGSVNVRPATSGVERAAPPQNNIDIVNFIDPSVLESFVTTRQGRETIINMLSEEGAI